ncbi:MAG: MFS transporter [Peptococcaceae bacterium]|nr:MFS transporter [Peptococcaceae bacterium]
MYSSKYQRTLVILFCLSWGFVFLDRQAITFVFPMLVEEFQMSMAEVGSITMWCSLAFAISGIIFGVAADRTGYRKRLLIPFLILGALFSGLTAIGSTVFMLMVIRFLVGFFEGPVYPLQTTMMQQQTDPKKFAVNIGIISMGGVILSAIIGPIMVTQLAYHFDWHLAFIITATPAFIVALIIAFYSKEVDREKIIAGRGEKTSIWSQFAELCKYKNFIICVILQILVMGSSWGAATYGGVFWVQEGGFTQEQFGVIMTVFGIMGVLYNLIAPRVADRIGRRPTCAILFFLMIIPGVAMYFSASFFVLILSTVFGPVQTFLIQLIQGIIGNESVPPHLASTNTAILMGVGEILGAAVLVRILGSVADAFGVSTVFLISAITALIGGLVALALQETNPNRKIPQTQTTAAK